MPRAEWRSPAAYKDLRTLDAPGFAWEFLSRNPAFEHDRKRLEQASEDRPLSADELNGFARRWGVRFRESSAWRRSSSSSLDSGELAERDPSDQAPTRSHRSPPTR
jgi:transcriptional regulator